MSIEAKIICDSINVHNKKRLTTYVLKYPRWIHSEFMTHRVFSRNAASSRAIPTNKFINMVTEDPAMPVYFGQNKPGMQASEQISPENQDKAKQIWLQARDSMVYFSKELQDLGVHKQLTNRLIENFMHITVLCTATEYENFFKLRTHKDAQPEFQELATKMLEEYLVSEPIEKSFSKKLADENCWHIPFGDQMPEELDLETKIKVAISRCARLSYLTFDGEINVEKDLDLYNKLSTSGHFSPFEHIGRITNDNNGIFQSGNFCGWEQYRKTLNNENGSFDWFKIIKSDSKKEVLLDLNSLHGGTTKINESNLIFRNNGISQWEIFRNRFGEHSNTIQCSEEYLRDCINKCIKFIKGE